MHEALQQIKWTDERKHSIKEAEDSITHSQGQRKIRQDQREQRAGVYNTL